MKGEKNETLKANVADRNERAKKLYRYVSDVARRIDEATAASRSLSDLYSTNIEIQRQKLRDNCEKLMFIDPLNYGKKSLELLWRKVYYESVSAAKKLRDVSNDYDSFLSTHIICGIGHFHHLITKIQSEMKIHFKELDYTSFFNDEETEVLNENIIDDELQCAKSAVHSCLIYLGDLSRYQAEIFNALEYVSTAARYYHQASLVDTSSGMPYNQLGNLYLDKNYNLDAVCYYIHCMSCISPFEGVMDNLTKLFEKNNQFLQTLNNSDTISQTEHIQSTISNFLSLIEIWYMSTNDTNIPQRCNTIAHELKIAFDFKRTTLPDINKNYNEYVQAVEEEAITPTYLNGNIIFKIVQICLFTLAKIIEVDEHKAFACKAFTLALLSRLLQNLLKQIELFGLKNPAPKFHLKHKSVSVEDIEKKEEVVAPINGETLSEIILKEETKSDIEEQKNSSVENLEENESVENPKQPINGDQKGIKKTKRRRRRRPALTEGSDLSDADIASSESETDDDSSDEEHTSDSLEQSGDETRSVSSYSDVSDTEGEPGKVNGTIYNSTKEIDETNMDKQVDKVDIIDKNEQDNPVDNKLDVVGIQNFLLGDNFLPSIKLLLDWVLTEKDLILSCGDSGEDLFQCVVDLLNIFTHYFNPKNNNEVIKNDECKILDYAKSVAKNFKLEYKTIPLPEDVDLRGTNVCKFDKDAAEWQILERYKPSVYEENVIRILNFIDFGNQIAKIVPKIRYNRTLRVFYLKKTPSSKLNLKINHKRSREWHNSKRQHGEESEGGLLRRLGRLWLASQVRELERSGRASAPELLALDAEALHSHLRRVKHLLKSRNFILLIPTVVVQELDELKRDCSGARDAIRWLETQLRSGSRFVRAQRPEQARPLTFLKYPKKAPAQVNSFVQILEFCNQLVGDEKQAGGGEPSASRSLLVLLVGSEPPDCRDFSPMGAARAAGIPVQCIENFYTRWRRSMHKNPNKR